MTNKRNSKEKCNVTSMKTIEAIWRRPLELADVSGLFISSIKSPSDVEWDGTT